MLACDAGQDQLVRWGVQNTPSLSIARPEWAPLGHAVAAMEYDLVAVGFDCALHCHAVGDEVEGLDVAVQETGVLDRDQLVGPVLPVEAARLGKKPLGWILHLGEGVLAMRYGTRGLPVQHVRRIRIQTGDKVVQHGGECVPLHWRIDAEQRRLL